MILELARILHEGGHLTGKLHYVNDLHGIQPLYSWSRFALFGFRPDLPSQTTRSVSNHSYGYGFSPDQPVCFAISTLDSESFVQYAG